MKTVRIIVVIGALLFVSATAHATLIDLTPGGFSLLNLPPVVIQWEQTIQQQGIFVIAHADITGNTVAWYPGLLGEPNFSVDPMVENASVMWNLTNVSGGSFLYLIVGNSNPSVERANLYQVSLDEIINGHGFVTIDGQTTIAAMNFFGRVNVPDEANTGTLLLLAVIAVLLTYEAQRRRTRPLARAFQSSCQHHRIRESQRDVNGYRIEAR